jgi:hypothetical protein
METRKPETRTAIFMFGMLLLFGVGMIPAAMVGASEALCDRTKGGQPELHCVGSMPTWVEYARQGAGMPVFERSSANLVFGAGVTLAALLIPAAFGYLTRRWEWAGAAACVAELSVVLGLVAGIVAAPRIWPEYAARLSRADGQDILPVLIFAPFYALVLATPFAATSAVVGIACRINAVILGPARWLVLLAALGVEGGVLWWLLKRLGLGIYS